jgi:hypothetical protein
MPHISHYKSHKKQCLLTQLTQLIFIVFYIKTDWSRVSSLRRGHAEPQQLPFKGKLLPLGELWPLHRLGTDALCGQRPPLSLDPDCTFMHKPVFSCLRSRIAVHLQLYLSHLTGHMYILFDFAWQIHVQQTLSSIFSVLYVTREFDYEGMSQTGIFVYQTVGRTWEFTLPKTPATFCKLV